MSRSPRKMTSEMCSVAGDVLERISVHQQQIGVVACTNQADASIGMEQASAVVRRGLKRHRWRDASFDPKSQLVMNGRTVRQEHEAGAPLSP